MRRGKGQRALGRLGSLVIAGVVTSAVVAAIALAASKGPPPSNPNKGDAPAGQVQLGTGATSVTFPMLAYSWGVSNTGSAHVGGGAGAGKANVQDISFTKAMDATTVELLKKVTTGAHYPEVVVTATQPGTSAKFVLALEDVLVTSVSLGGSGEPIQTENVSLNFKKVTWTHTDATGHSTPGSWNVVTNTP